MLEVCVQGGVFGVTANVASQGRLKSWRRQLVVAACVAAFVFFCGLKGNVYSFLCRGNCARVVLKLMWDSVRPKLD